YLARTADGLVFASEVRALLASGLIAPKLDAAGVAGLLAYGAVQHPRTLFRDVTSLPAGCWQAFTADDWATGGPRPFWHYPALRPDVGAEEAVGSIRGTLDRAVRDHLVS